MQTELETSTKCPLWTDAQKVCSVGRTNTSFQKIFLVWNFFFCIKNNKIGVHQICGFVLLWRVAADSSSSFSCLDSGRTELKLRRRDHHRDIREVSQIGDADVGDDVDLESQPVWSSTAQKFQVQNKRVLLSLFVMFSVSCIGTRF